MHIIPGPQGLNKGLFIAQASSFTVLIFAFVGTILTRFVGTRLSLYLHDLDVRADFVTTESASSGAESEKASDDGKLAEPFTVEQLVSLLVAAKELKGREDHVKLTQMEVEADGNKYLESSTENVVKVDAEPEAAI